jgi:hypothetical protein
MKDAPHFIPPFQGLSWDDFEVSGLGLLGYHIILEAISNAAEHSAAKKCASSSRVPA